MANATQNPSKVDASKIKEHAAVVGSDDQHVGTVDHVYGDLIKLTKSDPQAGGVHHTIAISTVASIDGGTVKLAHSAADAMKAWKSA